MSKASQKKLHFIENFGLSGAAAIISKTAAAPIERVKLLVQNQDEMLKQGRLQTPYRGVIDCTTRTYRAEGFLAFWRGMEILLLFLLQVIMYEIHGVPSPQIRKNPCWQLLLSYFTMASQLVCLTKNNRNLG